MQRFLLRLVITALAVVLASYVFPDLIRVNDAAAVFVFALVLGILNAFVRPVLLLLALPLTLLTLGLFTLVVNALVFWFASLFVSGGVDVNGWLGAFVGALVVSIVSFLASRAFK